MTDFDTYYTKYFNDVQRFIYSRVQDWDVATDLAQDVFFRAWKQPPLEQPKHWLLKTARNIAIDEIKRIVRHRKLDALYAHDKIARGVVHQPESDDLLILCYQQLSETDQQLLKMWSNGCDYPEIANKTGLSIKSIGTSLKRARTRLKEKYLTLDKTAA